MKPTWAPSVFFLLSVSFLVAADRGPSKQGRQCSADAECVMVPADCCGCNNGGKQHAVPRAQAEREQRAQEQRCKGTMCPHFMSHDASCQAAARCAEGQCEPK